MPKAAAATLVVTHPRLPELLPIDCSISEQHTSRPPDARGWRLSSFKTVVMVGEGEPLDQRRFTVGTPAVCRIITLWAGSDLEGARSTLAKATKTGEPKWLVLTARFWPAT